MVPPRWRTPSYNAKPAADVSYLAGWSDYSPVLANAYRGAVIGPETYSISISDVPSPLTTEIEYCGPVPLYWCYWNPEGDNSSIGIYQPNDGYPGWYIPGLANNYFDSVIWSNLGGQGQYGARPNRAAGAEYFVVSGIGPGGIDIWYLWPKFTLALVCVPHYYAGPNNQFNELLPADRGLEGYVPDSWFVSLVMGYGWTSADSEVSGVNSILWGANGTLSAPGVMPDPTLLSGMTLDFQFQGQTSFNSYSPSWAGTSVTLADALDLLYFGPPVVPAIPALPFS